MKKNRSVIFYGSEDEAACRVAKKMLGNAEIQITAAYPGSEGPSISAGGIAYRGLKEIRGYIESGAL